MYKKDVLNSIYSITENFESQYEEIDQRVEKYFFLINRYF